MKTAQFMLQTDNPSGRIIRLARVARSMVSANQRKIPQKPTGFNTLNQRLALTWLRTTGPWLFNPPSINTGRTVKHSISSSHFVVFRLCEHILYPTTKRPLALCNEVLIPASRIVCPCITDRLSVLTDYPPQFVCQDKLNKQFVLPNNPSVSRIYARTDYQAS